MQRRICTQYCSSGVCVACGAGKTYCDYGCFDLSSDPSHCGACNGYCSHPSYTQGTCTQGVCGWICLAGHVDCDGAPANGCEVYVNSDRNNCGTCGHVCADDETCSSGICTPCPAGTAPCAPYNSCVDILASSANCGACGAACQGSFAHGHAACASGTCTLACDAGHLDCDGNSLDGCEVVSNEANCGACGVACAPGEFCSVQGCAACSPTPLGSIVPQSVTGTTIGGSNELKPTCGNGASPDARFSFVAPAAGTYTFDTSGSSFDTVLEVRADTCSGPSLGCNDNAGNLPTSKVAVALAAGQTVIVVVDGSLGSQGPFVLHVN